MNAVKKHQLWLKKIGNESDRNFLKNMTQEEIEECFEEDIKFGTGGLRGIMSLGSARMNIYTISKVTRGLGKYLQEKYPNKALKVALATDPRHMHQEFSRLIVRILGTLGIKVVMFNDIKPTPMLSFVVRQENCDAGIMITASHNPKQYNGYKVYNKTGAQLNLAESEKMIDVVNTITDIFNMEFKDFPELEKNNLIEVLTDEYDQKYLEGIKNIIANKKEKAIKIVFTPEHGCSYKIMPKAFEKFGFKNIIPVTEQMVPDPEFSKTKSANPEELEAYELALLYAKKNNADLIIANDPDADRLGIGFLAKDGNYHFFSGNQTGVLLIDYLIKRDNLTSGIIYKTIVTGELGATIASEKGLKVSETLTGFKFIGEKIAQNQDDQFIFGYEESYGYLIDEVVRDKDAIQSSLLIAEMTDFYLSQNLRLDEVINSLYEKYGYFHEVTKSISLEGKSGLKKIEKTMEFFRLNKVSKLGNVEIEQKSDYLCDIDDLPKADVIKLFLSEQKGWIAFRPSGTEPKLKVYISIKGDTLSEAKTITNNIYQEILGIMGKIDD